jgi:16S rRNA G1207 methylase RsmC
VAIVVCSKLGLPDWDRLLPSTRLFAESIEIKLTDHVFLFGAHHGALCVYLARHLTDGKLTITDHDFIAIEMTKCTLAANHIHPKNQSMSYRSDLPQTEHNSYDSVLIQIPKGRHLCDAGSFRHSGTS